MKTPLILTTAIALTLSSAVFAQPNAPSESSAANTGQKQSQQLDTRDQNRFDQEFVRDASSGNNMEIQLGQYIAQHTQNPQTKQLAETLIRDHQQNEQLLQQAAAQAGIHVSDQLTPLHKARLHSLEKKSGDELDRDFAFGAIADHHHDLLDFQYAAKNLQNPQLRQYASKSIPALQTHLNMANQLAQSIAGVQDVAVNNPASASAR